MKRINSYFRLNAMNIALVVIVVAMMAVLCLQALATNRLQEQVEGQRQLINQVKDVATSLDKHAAERTQQIDQLNRHLDCIVTFFAQKDRSAKAIADIDTCALQNINTGATSQPTTSSPVRTTAPTQSQVTVTPTPANSTQAAPVASRPSLLTPVLQPANSLFNAL